jgi:hypothetical protein
MVAGRLGKGERLRFKFPSLERHFFVAKAQGFGCGADRGLRRLLASDAIHTAGGLVSGRALRGTALFFGGSLARNETNRGGARRRRVKLSRLVSRTGCFEDELAIWMGFDRSVVPGNICLYGQN